MFNRYCIFQNVKCLPSAVERTQNKENDSKRKIMFKETYNRPKPYDFYYSCASVLILILKTIGLPNSIYKRHVNRTDYYFKPHIDEKIFIWHINWNFICRIGKDFSEYNNIRRINVNRFIFINVNINIFINRFKI